MTTPTLRTLINAASEALETYRRPNISEAQARIVEVMRALEIGHLIEDETIDSIDLGDNGALITTTYGPGRAQCHYEIPAAVIDATDPVAAAKLWRLQERVRVMEARLTYQRQNAEHAEQALTGARLELAEHLASLQPSQ